MSAANNSPSSPHAVDVLIVAPQPPPYGGMAIQAKLLEKLLIADGLSVAFFASNLEFPRFIRFVAKIPFIRTLIRTSFIWLTLWRHIQHASVVHVLAASRVYFFAVVAPAVLYARFGRKHLILNYRGGDARVFFRTWHFLVSPIMRRATVVTAPSGFLASEISTGFQVPVTIVRNILDKSIFQYRERNYFNPRILITRHLEPIYDVETALKAFKALQQTCAAASLTIAGTGSQQSYLLEYARRLGLKNVSFLGGVSHEKLGEVYDACDILLNTSRIDNFPGSLLEASGAGLVIVSTNPGGIPHMYSHRESALLSEPGDWKALTAHLRLVVEDQQLASRLARRAQSLAKECEWAQVRRSLYRVYGFDICRTPAMHATRSFESLSPE